MRLTTAYPHLTDIQKTALRLYPQFNHLSRTSRFYLSISCKKTTNIHSPPPFTSKFKCTHAPRFISGHPNPLTDHQFTPQTYPLHHHITKKSQKNLKQNFTHHPKFYSRDSAQNTPAANTNDYPGPPTPATAKHSRTHSPLPPQPTQENSAPHQPYATKVKFPKNLSPTAHPHPHKA